MCFRRTAPPGGRGERPWPMERGCRARTGHRILLRAKVQKAENSAKCFVGERSDDRHSLSSVIIVIHYLHYRHSSSSFFNGVFILYSFICIIIFTFIYYYPRIHYRHHYRHSSSSFHIVILQRFCFCILLFVFLSSLLFIIIRFIIVILRDATSRIGCARSQGLG